MNELKLITNADKDEMNTFRFVMFDVDGTLIDRDSGLWLPGAKERLMARPGHQRIAFVTNQGGVGLRYWMEGHDPENKWGDPGRYPTEQDILTRYRALAHEVYAAGLYICFAYQSKKTNQWGPVPPGREFEFSWRPENRKPAPGMLIHAMRDAGMEPGETLMVGDSATDFAAAQAAGCYFMWAKDFFHRPDSPGQSS